MLFMNKNAKPLSLVYIQILDVPFCSQYREIIDFLNKIQTSTLYSMLSKFFLYFFLIKTRLLLLLLFEFYFLEKFFQCILFLWNTFNVVAFFLFLWNTFQTDKHELYDRIVSKHPHPQK